MTSRSESSENGAAYGPSAWKAYVGSTVTQADTDRIMREFDGALNTAVSRDGGQVVNLALRVWELFESGSLSPNTKVLVALALLYFILPWDLIPDVTPIIGYADDAAVLMAVISQIGTISGMAKTARGMFRNKYSVPE